MHKEQNVIRFNSLLLLLLICSVSFSFSQKKLKGTFMSNDNAKYIFSSDNVFKIKYFESSHGQLKGYAKGHYQIKNDSLILISDLTKLKEGSYHRLKSYSNSKDSITINIQINNFDNKPLENIQVWSYPKYKSTESNDKGFATLKFKKGKEKIQIEIVGEFLVKDIIYLDTSQNHEIDVFLSRNEVYNWFHPTAYKDDVVKYKILKFSKEEIKLKTQNIFLILKRRKD